MDSPGGTTGRPTIRTGFADKRSDVACHYGRVRIPRHCAGAGCIDFSERRNAIAGDGDQLRDLSVGIGDRSYLDRDSPPRFTGIHCVNSSPLWPADSKCWPRPLSMKYVEAGRYQEVRDQVSAIKFPNTLIPDTRLLIPDPVHAAAAGNCGAVSRQHGSAATRSNQPRRCE